MTHALALEACEKKHFGVISFRKWKITFFLGFHDYRDLPIIPSNVWEVRATFRSTALRTSTLESFDMSFKYVDITMHSGSEGSWSLEIAATACTLTAGNLSWSRINMLSNILSARSSSITASSPMLFKSLLISWQTRNLTALSLASCESSKKVKTESRKTLL